MSRFTDWVKQIVDGMKLYRQIIARVLGRVMNNVFNDFSDYAKFYRTLKFLKSPRINKYFFFVMDFFFSFC